jgi:hypothetical protein
MANAKIPPNLEPLILKLAGNGKTTRQIAVALAGHGCIVGHVAVARFLQRVRASRAETAKAVVRGKLAGTLTSDLDSIEVERQRLVRLCAALGGAAEERKLSGPAILKYLRTLDRLAKLTDLRLHYSGAGEPDGPTDDGASTRVLARLGALVDAAGPTAPAGPATEGSAP